ncbi:MAG: hypothetical protein RLZZ303_3780 [Candidatus Hydrogenedentota bacterium]|jgi:beta-glucosidase-like glycosyl hydrolase
MMALRWLLILLVLLPLGVSSAQEAQPRSGESLEEKCERLFMASWPVEGLPHAWREALAAGELHAVALSPGDNYFAPEELSSLIAQIHEAVERRPSFLIAAPCEGGLRGAMHPLLGGPPVPEPLALAATGSVATVEQAYASLAATMRAQGIALGIGPWMGMSGGAQSTRAFGADAERVVNFADAAINGMRGGGLLAAPVLSADAPLPAAGVLIVDDSVADPAALARQLREVQGYAGALVSPPLNEALDGVTALNAGYDLLRIHAAHPRALRQQRAGLLEGLRSGAVSLARLDEALLRASSLNAPPPVTQRQAESNAFEVNGAVFVKNSDGLLPLRGSRSGILVVSPAAHLSLGGPFAAGATLGSAIRAIAPEAREVRVSHPPTPAQIEQALSGATGATALVLGIVDASSAESYRDLATSFAGMGKPVIAVSLGGPEALEPFAGVDALVAANGHSPPALRAAARALLGEAAPEGRLPAPIGRFYPAGHAAP